MVFVPDYITEDNPKAAETLRRLEQEGVLTTTPSQDSNWAYMLSLAYDGDGCVVSNSSHREMSRGLPRHMAIWARSHIISFTFVGDDFLPNPDFVYPEPAAASAAVDCKPAATTTTP